MSPDHNPLDRVRRKPTASTRVPARFRRWPVHRSDLELFLSVDAPTNSQTPEVDQALEGIRDNLPEQGDPRSPS